jgi:hypothetical protein
MGQQEEQTIEKDFFLKKKKGSNKKLLKIVGSLISSTSAYRVLYVYCREGLFSVILKRKKKNDWNGGDKEAWLILGDIVVVVGWRGSLCSAESICIV